jgi:hypothetical protein
MHGGLYLAIIRGWCRGPYQGVIFDTCGGFLSAIATAMNVGPYQVIAIGMYGGLYIGIIE